MKTSTFFSRYIALLLLLLFTSVNIYAQRNFATTQKSSTASLLCLGCTVTGQGAAIDGNLQTHSTLNVTLGVAASTYQELIFPGAAKVAAGTPVTIKLGTGDNLLDLTALGGITIRAYNGTVAVGGGVSAATLVSAASNNNQVQLSITPTQTYDRVRVTLNGGLLGALSSIYLYEAFYNGPANVACNNAFDELHGVSSALLNLGVNVGGVANPANAIDGNINTASTLNAGVAAVGAYAQQTIIYEKLSVLGDSIRMTLSLPQALIDAGVLTNISITTYNGNTNNNDAVFFNSALLNLRLLDLAAGRRKVTITYAPTKTFDRVQLRLGGGVANALSSLNLFEAEKLIPRPVIRFNNVVTDNANICAGSTVTLTATAVPNTTFNWYTAATGGSPVHTGASYSPGVLAATTTYYVSAMRAGCTDESERAPVTVTVNPIPLAPVITNNNISVCPGGTATFTVQPVSGVTINWFAAATGGTPIATGNSFTTGAISAITIFYAEATAGGACPSPTRTAVTATLSPLPATPALTANNVTICTGDVAILSIASPVAGQTYNWYSTATGGTSLFTGVNFTTPALTSNATYYAEAVNITGCASSARVQANVTVSPKPANPILAANNLTVSAGQTATINVTNAQTGVTYNWYTSASAATPVHTGNNYTTPQLYTNTTYYVAGINAAGCESVSRTAITINVTINNNTPCTFANAQTPAVNGLCIGCTITNDALATDADTTTASTIRVTAGLLGGNAQQTLVFPQPGFAGDTVKLVLSTPVGLADVALLGQISVALYNGATLIGRYPLDNALLKLNLLSGGGNRYAVYIPATAAYDRAEIRLSSGVATLLTSLNVYYAAQQYPTPVFANGSPQICSGSPATLTVSSPTNGSFRWYTTPTGGTSSITGATYVTGNLTTTTTYYVEYSRGTCVSPTRYPITVTVNEPPAKPTVIPPSATITAGQTATFKATAATGAIVNWYETATGGTIVFTGNTFTTPALSANKTYYAEAVLGSCPSPDRTVVPVTVTPVVIPNVTVVPPTQAVDPGTSATLTASSTTPGTTFNWYTASTGGSIIYTGATFNTPPVFTPTTYYAEAVVTATGVRSATRAPGAITLNAVSNNPVPCDAAITQTNNTSGLLCVLCAISNPNGAIDNNRNTFSQLSVPVGLVGGYAEQILRFANTGRSGDSVIVELGVPGALASVGVLSQISLATYNGTTFNNDRTAINGALITVNLLSGTSRFRVAFKANADFDRIEIRLNSGVAGVLSALNIYDATQVVPAPVIAAPSVTTCQGTQATLTATVPSHVTVKWYTTAQGGSPIATGATFNTPVLTANRTYYAEASRTADGCTQTTRTPVTVTVTPTPAAPVVTTPTVTVCSGQPATFTANTVAGVTFAWYTTPTGGTPVSTANPFTTGPLTATTVYYVEAQGAGQCGSSTRTQVTANVTATPLVPTVSQNPTQTCSGSSAMLTASSTQPGATFNWYTTATGGTPVFTGPTYTTPVLTANTSYYVEATLGTCTSPTRAKADVVVNPTPVAPVVTINPAGGQIASGQTATLTATSTTAGATFKWYTSASGGTAIFTGNSFTTPALTSTTTYYVESVLAATGCTSPVRTPVTVTVNPIFSTSCDFASTQTTDVNAGVACIGCTVTSPNQSVDPDTTTASQINLPLAIGSYVGQTLIFSDGGLAGDSVTIKIGAPSSLLAAGILSRIQVASYNGATYNGDRTNISTGAISLRLLAGNTVAVIRFAPGANYDRVEVRFNSALAALNTFNIFYASKQVDAPTVAATTVNICSGGKATFTVSNPRPGVTYTFYTTATGNTVAGTGTTFTTNVLNSTQTYYVGSSRTSNGCANPNRVAVTANVTPTPVNPTLNQTTATICAGDNVTLTVTNAGTSTVRWYSAATNGTLLFTGPSYTVSPIITTSYYAELTNSGACSSPARTQATVTVNPRPAKPGVLAANLTVCSGSPATLTVQNPEAGVTYNWYTAATGGTIAYTGAVVNTDPVTANTTFYVEAVNNAGGCSNNGGRTSVNVTVTAQVNAPTLNAVTTQVCAGGSVTISVNNPVAGQQYNFYTAATGGTPVFTGTSYTINNVTADASYFVEAANGTCTSATRTRSDITVTAAPTPPQVQAPAGGLVACNGSDITISIANPQPDLVYRWYSAATGGTLLYTGTQYTTTITANTTFYVEAASAGACNPSTRTAVTVTVSPLPADPTVGSPSVSVCPGSSATLSVTSPQAGITYRWYNSPAQTTVLFTGTTYVTDAITATTNFYVAAFNSAGCSSANLAQVQVTTRPAPAAPVVANGSPVSTCEGSAAIIAVTDAQAGYTYNFYTVATGGTSTFTGTSFTTPVLTNNTTYYVEAVNDDGCPSTTRTTVTVTVNQAPAAPTVAATGTRICPNNSTVLTAVATGGNTVKWYAAATGGTALFTGTNFTTPVLSSNTTYYAEAVSTTTACASLTRTPVTVTILGPLAAPVVSVLTSTTSSVTFTYAAVPDATGYEVSLDNGLTFIMPSSGAAGLVHTVTGLNPGQTVTIVVRALGNVDCLLSANSIALTGTATNPFGDGLFVPNAFTPNGDGNNDILYVYGNTIQKVAFSIYDQWGEQQFRSTNQGSGWDGTYKGRAQPVGVYVYYVEVTLNNGQIVKKRGTVTLIR